jgi:hypothetical protein
MDDDLHRQHPRRRSSAREDGAKPDFETALDLATRTPHGILFKTRPAPAFIDRNRSEAYDAETCVARMLLPLQVQAQEPFGGERWTPETRLEGLEGFSS